MKLIGNDWFALDTEEIKRYVSTARGLSSIPGVRVWGAPPNRGWLSPVPAETLKVDIHRSHLPLLSGLTLTGTQHGDHHAIPVASRGWLRPFQLEAVSWLRQRHGAILALDLGGGKTATATAAADLPIVVGVPVSVIDVWKTECRRNGWTFHVCRDVEELKTTLKLGKTDCYILPYSMADKLAGYFTSHRMGTVLCDEAHTVANKYVTWSQAFRGIPRDRTYLITATPMRNRLVSLWGLLDAACSKGFGGRNEFRARYCGAAASPYGGMIDMERTNVDELASRLTEVVYKRTRAQMAIPLPAHHRNVVELRVARKFPTLSEILNGISAPTGAHLTIINELRQHISAEKARAVPVGHVQLTHHRVVWWIWFRETAKILEERIKAFNIPVDVMTGDAPTAKRTRILEEWSSPDKLHEPRALIASIAAASTGISLSNARAAQFVDLDWTPLNLLQAEKRHHRFGSLLPELWTTYYVVPGTVDEAMALSLMEKQGESEGALGKDGSLEQMRSLLDEENFHLPEQEIVARAAKRMLSGAHHEENCTNPGA